MQPHFKIASIVLCILTDGTKENFLFLPTLFSSPFLHTQGHVKMYQNVILLTVQLKSQIQIGNQERSDLRVFHNTTPVTASGSVTLKDTSCTLDNTGVWTWIHHLMDRFQLKMLLP